MEPHLPWVPECEQECYLLTPCHVPGPATELVSVEINCSLNTHLFIYSTGGLSFVKTPDAPALLQDIYKGLLLCVLRRSLGSHSFRHLFFFFLYSPCLLEMRSFFLMKELTVLPTFIFMMSFLDSRA